MKKGLLIRKTKFLSVLLIVAAMLLCLFTPVSALSNTEAVGIDICVIYDNSASTFQDQTWCRYKYALEILASMIDYEAGAQLFIYPLCDVSLDGRVSSASTEPIKIDSYADISKISNIYTVRPAGTSFEAVVEAEKFLTQESSAEQKHLVILTDGQFAFDTSEQKLETELLSIAKKSAINVHYIGSGDAVPVTPNEAKGLYTYHMAGLVDTQYLLDLVADLCGTLFNHSKALSTKAQQTKLNLTGSGKVIIYASGQESTVISLTDTDMISMPLLYDTGRHTYSTTAAETFHDAPVDTTLESYISIFECFEPGEYTLNCANSDLVNIYLQQVEGSITPAASPTESTDESVQPPGLWRQVLAIGTIVGFAFILISIAVTLWIIAKSKPAKAVSQAAPKENEPQQKPLPYKGNESYIFVSYSHKDADEVLPIVHQMIRDGYRVWYDEGIDPGTEWDDNIAKHINHCGYFIAFMSDHYLHSANCKDELNYARDLDKSRFLVYLEKLVLPEAMQMRLNRIQNIHKYAYDDAQRFYEKLYQADGLSAHKNKPAQ